MEKSMCKIISENKKGEEMQGVDFFVKLKQIIIQLNMNYLQIIIY